MSRHNFNWIKRKFSENKSVNAKQLKKCAKFGVIFGLFNLNVRKSYFWYKGYQYFRSKDVVCSTENG